jgi:hypothetical protein
VGKEGEARPDKAENLAEEIRILREAFQDGMMDCVSDEERWKMVYVIHCAGEIMTRKAKQGLPEGTKFIKDKNDKSFFVSSDKTWDVLLEWGKKFDAIIGVVNGGEEAI